MNTLALHQLVGKIYQFLSQRIVYHLIFWVIFVCLLSLAQSWSSTETFWFTMSNTAIFAISYGIVVYFNTLYLIPNFLMEKKFLRYCGLLLLSVFIVTSLKIFILYIKFYNYKTMQIAVLEGQVYQYLLTFIVAGASTIFKIITDWIRDQREKQVLQTQTMQSELKFLRSQINPHFLFNTLNNLYALTLKKSDKAPDIVLKLSEMMRYMLYECNERQVPLSKEMSYLQNYLDLERLRQGKNVDINLDVDGVVSNQMIAPLLIIPFVENSFKHGLSNHIDPGFVNIQLTVTDKLIHICVSNSKPEKMPMQETRRSGGIGLVNVRRRLNLLYPNQHSLNIKESPNTYEVNLLLNLS